MDSVNSILILTKIAVNWEDPTINASHAKQAYIWLQADAPNQTSLDAWKRIQMEFALTVQQISS